MMNFFCKSVVLTAVFAFVAVLPVGGVTLDCSLASGNGVKEVTIIPGVGVGRPDVVIVFEGVVPEDYIPLCSLSENAADVRLGYELGYLYGMFPAEELDEIEDWVELYDRTDWASSGYVVP